MRHGAQIFPDLLLYLNRCGNRPTHPGFLKFAFV
jgi:hypothetical protein